MNFSLQNNEGQERGLSFRTIANPGRVYILLLKYVFHLIHNETVFNDEKRFGRFMCCTMI